MARVIGVVTSGRRTAELWFGILTGPLASLVMTQVDYLVVPWACARHDNPAAMALLHLVPLVLLALTLAAGVVAWRNFAKSAPEDGVGETPRGATDARPDEGDTNGRGRFMAEVGIASSALFSLVLIAQWIPVFMLHPCLRG